MRFARKILAAMLMAAMVLGLFTGTSAEAAQKGKPKISLKYVNSKTGVKITIGKTVGADAYKVYLKGCGDSYVDYWSDFAKNNLWRGVEIIKKNGKVKRTYTIKGLPEGTYSIKVAALKKVVNVFGEENYQESLCSTEKTVKIMAPTNVKVKEKTYDFSKVKVGDSIFFGSYEQDGIMTNGKEDIEWIVLSKNKSQMLVLSKYALDCLPYDTNMWAEHTWEACTLRKWLNNCFYKSAFTKAERSLIKKTKIKNTDNPEYGTEGGKNTNDNVFLLSLDDMINTAYGFSSIFDECDLARKCTSTTYTLTQGSPYGSGTSTVGSSISTTYEVTKNSGFKWWLRSPGCESWYAGCVDFDGSVNLNGNCVDDDAGVVGDDGFDGFGVRSGLGVRPALYIDLQS